MSTTNQNDFKDKMRDECDYDTFTQETWREFKQQLEDGRLMKTDNLGGCAVCFYHRKNKDDDEFHFLTYGVVYMGREECTLNIPNTNYHFGILDQKAPYQDWIDLLNDGCHKVGQNHITYTFDSEKWNDSTRYIFLNHYESKIEDV